MILIYMLSIKKINNEKVKPLNLPKVDLEKVKCKNLFENPFSNIFICAKKNSGKSVLIYKILKNTVNKLSKVFFFVSTIYKDATYAEILKMLDKKGVEHSEFTSLYEGKENNLQVIINQLGEKPKEEVLEEKLKVKYIRCDSSEEEDEYEYKPKKIAPQYVFVFDDISSELKDPSISYLLKRNRHFKSMCLLSSQYLFDIRPESRLQLDYFIAFGGMPEDKLKVIHQNLDLSIDYELFKEMYYEAVNERYNFFYIDVRKETFRKNFCYQFELEK